MVTILTDGSGPDRPPRLESTRKILESIGCSPGSLFGGLKDREIYEMMQEGPAPFITIAAKLEKEWSEQGVTTVAGDALEGFSTTHDVCRMIINAVVERARRRRLEWRNYSFALDKLTGELADAAVMINLDDETFRWKQALVRDHYPEMAAELARVIAKHGEAMFRSERLHEAPAGRAGLLWENAERPYYETYGARQIEKGHYQKLITYQEHLLPIADGLWTWACMEECAGSCAS